MIYILQSKEYKQFIEKQLSTPMLHFSLEYTKRNIDIFNKCLETFYNNLSTYGMLSKTAKSHNLSKQRVSDIFNKYMIHFIVYNINELDHKYEDNYISFCCKLLNKQSYKNLQDYIDTGKTIKQISNRDLYFIR